MGFSYFLRSENLGEIRYFLAWKMLGVPSNPNAPHFTRFVLMTRKNQNRGSALFNFSSVEEHHPCITSSKYAYDPFKAGGQEKQKKWLVLVMPNDHQRRRQHEIFDYFLAQKNMAKLKERLLSSKLHVSKVFLCSVTAPLTQQTSILLSSP